MIGDLNHYYSWMKFDSSITPNTVGILHSIIIICDVSILVTEISIIRKTSVRRVYARRNPRYCYRRLGRGRQKGRLAKRSRYCYRPNPRSAILTTNIFIGIWRYNRTIYRRNPRHRSCCSCRRYQKCQLDMRSQRRSCPAKNKNTGRVIFSSCIYFIYAE